MLWGFSPFYDDCNEKLFEKIKNAEYSFESPYWDDISESAKDLISKIFVVDPEQRITLNKMKQHPWLIHEYEQELIQDNSNTEIKISENNEICNFKQENNEFALQEMKTASSLSEIVDLNHNQSIP